MSNTQSTKQEFKGELSAKKRMREKKRTHHSHLQLYREVRPFHATSHHQSLASHDRQGAVSAFANRAKLLPIRISYVYSSETF
jgi:hypothetical protein